MRLLFGVCTANLELPDVDTDRKVWACRLPNSLYTYRFDFSFNDTALVYRSGIVSSVFIEQTFTIPPRLQLILLRGVISLIPGVMVLAAVIVLAVLLYGTVTVHCLEGALPSVSPLVS